MPADCIENVVTTKHDKILYQTIPTPRPPPKFAFERSLASTTRKRIAAATKHREIECRTGKIHSKIGLRVQGVPHEVSLEDRGRTTRIPKLTHTLILSLWTVHPENSARTESCLAWSYFITPTSVAQELQSSGLHIFVSLKQFVIHVSCLFPCRTWHWPQAPVLSHTFHPLLLSFRQSHLYKQALCSSTHIFAAMFHDRVGGSTKIPSLTGYEPKSVEIEAIETKAIGVWRPRAQKSWAGTDLYQTQEWIMGEKYRKDLWEILLLRIWTNLEELVPRCPTSSHRCIPIMTQRRALQTRDLEDGELPKMPASPLYMQSREGLWILSHANLHGKNLLHCHKKEKQVQSVLKLI